MTAGKTPGLEPGVGLDARRALADRGARQRAKGFQDDLNRYGAMVSYGLFENAVLAPEYLLTDPQAADSVKEHAVTAQLAFEF